MEIKDSAQVIKTMAKITKTNFLRIFHPMILIFNRESQKYLNNCLLRIILGMNFMRHKNKR